MYRLKTRSQFQAAMAAGAVSRTAHFALHRLALDAGAQALFGMPGVWLGAMVPKRWARRAVTRNAIKRQIYAVAGPLEPRMPVAAHVVRLRASFDRKHFVSATSDALKRAVRAELEQLFARAQQRERAP
jgi:ribonuclease P protein component